MAAKFHGLPYVKSIDLIPTTYLRPNGGFENLDQVKSMFGVDVIALVAYDQIQFTHEGYYKAMPEMTSKMAMRVMMCCMAFWVITR